MIRQAQLQRYGRGPRRKAHQLRSSRDLWVWFEGLQYTSKSTVAGHISKLTSKRGHSDWLSRAHRGKWGQPPGKVDEKLKIENMQKKSSFLCLRYILIAEQSGQAGVTALCWPHIYSDILQNAPFRSQIFTIFFASGGKGGGHWPPNQNPADVPAYLHYNVVTADQRVP